MRMLVSTLRRTAGARLRLRLALVLPVFASVSCLGEPDNIRVHPEYQAVAQSLESFIAWKMEVHDLPALSIALVDDQEVVWAKGFGFSDPEDSVPATARTVYRVGSVSKLFTDIAVMQLVERGELDLDAPVNEYLPDFTPHNPFGTPITLRQLTSHRSGLVREPPVGNYFDDTEPNLAATVASLNATQLVYEPETRVKYSNAGIAVVGYVLESTQGVPFADYVKSAVLEPLGMTHSAFQPEPELVNRLATAYMWAYDGRVYKAPDFQLGMGPAGSMYSTVIDLGHFMGALFAGGERNGRRILKSETLDSMWTPQFSRPGATHGTGLGFGVGTLGDHRWVGHSGAIYGFATQLAALPDEKLGAVVVTTKDVANGITELVADMALEMMLAVRSGDPLPEPIRTEPVPLVTARALAGRYTIDDAGIDLMEWNGSLFGWLSRGGSAFQLRMRGDTLVIDDVQDQGGSILPLDGDRLKIGRDTVVRAAMERPSEVPDRWRGLIGEYGWDHNTLFILEKDGQLHALIEWFFLYPLEQVTPDVYNFPDFGLYHGEQLIFARDASGRAIEVEAASVLFERRDVGPEEGQTFTIEPLRPVDELRRDALAASPPIEEGEFREPDLVELTALDSTIRLDIRYASTNNFMGAVFYQQPRAFLQRPAAEALVRAHRELAAHGYGLMIHDAYRPWYVTKMFWDATPEDKKMFVADPARGSRHNRGSAVDLTLYDLQTGQPVDMVATYDEMTERSYPNYVGGTSLQRWHRSLLRHAMEQQGFEIYQFEWWHFDHGDWREYPILNLTFEQLQN